MRGSDPAHHIHVTKKGDPKFVGLAYYVDSEDDLKRLSKAPGASAIEAIDEPGGGRRVRLTEPNGYQVEVVCGIAPGHADPRFKRQKLNSGEAPLRRPASDAPAQGPVARQAHRTRRADDAAEGNRRTGFARRWVSSCSDDVYDGGKGNVIGSFNRCDRGEHYVDHHVFFCLAHEKTGLNHLSFEVQDIDDVCMGHDYLKGFGAYEHMWGIGRHVLGSQVYDYWADPWGRVHEHWADSDRLNLANGSNSCPRRKRWCRNGARRRRRNSSITPARDRPTPSCGAPQAAISSLRKSLLFAI